MHATIHDPMGEHYNEEDTTRYLLGKFHSVTDEIRQHLSHTKWISNNSTRDLRVNVED